MYFFKKGAEYEMWVGPKDCKPVHEFWIDEGSYSVLVTRKCVRAYDERGCRGQALVLCPSDSEYVFHEMDFKGKLKSMGACRQHELQLCQTSDVNEQKPETIPFFGRFW